MGRFSPLPSLKMAVFKNIENVRQFAAIQAYER